MMLPLQLSKTLLALSFRQSLMIELTRTSRKNVERFDLSVVQVTGSKFMSKKVI